MGQKVNPNGFRYGVTKEHNVKWYANKDKFVSYILEDQKIRDFFEGFVRQYLIGKLEIVRDTKNHVTVKVHSANPGSVLGQGGENLKKLTNDVKKFVKNKSLDLNIQVIQIEKPELNARLLAEDIAIKLENRGNFRIAQKFAMRQALKAGAKGIKTSVAGRLNGVDMARTEGYKEGEMKLHTLRQDVDYSTARANTKYGVIGVKVWVSKGEILGGKR